MHCQCDAPQRPGCFYENPTPAGLKILLKSGISDWTAKILDSIIYLCRIAGTVLANGTPARGVDNPGPRFYNRI
jgi:hypothetical protein